MAQWTRPTNITPGETLTVKRASQSKFAEQDGVVVEVTPRGIVTLQLPGETTQWRFPSHWLYRRPQA